MNDTDRIKQAIFEAIEELNYQLPAEKQLAQSLDTVLFTSGGQLSSLELVNLIVAAEQNVEDEFGVSIILADERALSQRNSPFRTVAALVQYVALLLQEQVPAAYQL